MVVTVLVLLPIPVAVVFEAFRSHRAKILLRDRLREKEALFFCFMCIDTKKRGLINVDQWVNFMEAVFRGNVN